MFGATKNNQSGEKFKKIETFISHHTEFKGNISSKGSIRIDGIFEGVIEHADGVIIGETGIIKGDVNAQNVVIGGKISGNVISSESIDILDTAQIYGDISSSTLSIAEGAIFEGSCAMTKSGAHSTQVQETSQEGLDKNYAHTENNQYTQ